jgi:hypothetical protein
MIFEKVNSSRTNGARNWTPCVNCGYKNDNPPSAEYQQRSSATASEKNEANNGKSCVS